MSLDSKHPQYSARINDWETMRDTYEGERKVKEAGVVYLPPTSGMVADGMEGPHAPGRKAHDAYVQRAVFHGFVREAVQDLIGVMHHKPADIKVPKAMEPMLEHLSSRGESAQLLLRRINEAQLTTGRIGLLLDIPQNPAAGTRPLPYVAAYTAETIVNWDVGKSDDSAVETLKLVVLDETESERTNDFSWVSVTKYRVLALGPVLAVEGSPTLIAPDVYRAGVFRKTGTGSADFSEEAMIAPSLMGRGLDVVPFVFCNSSDVTAEPDAPPLLDLARLSLTIYRGEADYRQNLFMQGQDTLVTIGMVAESEEGDKIRVGAGSHISLPMDGDAKYIGVESSGLPEQREALENDKKLAQAKGGQMLDTTSRTKESGDALKTRVSAQTASLTQTALTGAFALETILRHAAKWMGLNPLEVTVKPNLDFDAEPMTGTDLAALMSAKNQGAPLARETIHNLMRAKNITDLSYEEEMDLIEEEKPLTLGITLPVDPNAEDDPKDPPAGGKGNA